MKIACLTTTYNRPELLASCLSQFERQTHTDKKLFVYDDYGQFEPVVTPTLHLASHNARAATLPNKYTVLLAMAAQWKPDAYALIDDDDLYTPDHLSRMAKGLESKPWCKPSRIWTTYGGTLHQERSDGRFCASIGFTATALQAAGGFVLTPRMDFDLQFLGRMLAAHGDPFDTADESPSYVFRWQDTNSPHAQGYSTGPGDASWYEKIKAKQPPPWVGNLEPRIDPAAQITFSELLGC